MRKALLEETCCELVLYLLIEKDCAQISEWGEWFNRYKMNEAPLDISNTMKELLKEVRYGLIRKEKELAKYGVTTRAANGKLSTDFQKWFAWWRVWYTELTSERVLELGEAVCPFTGEMAVEDIVKFRPKGRWQNVGE